MLECKTGYVFNKQTRQYIVMLKNAGRNLIIPEELHKNLMKAYCDDMPVDEMSIKFAFPAALIPEYKTVFQWKRRGIPITDEDAEGYTAVECAEKMLEEKKFDILQEFNKQSWKQTQSDALKWQEFEYSKLNPFESFLETWTPPKYVPKKFSETKCSEKSLILGVSDVHFGLFAQERYLYTQKEWTIEDTKECIVSYAKQVRQFVNERKGKFKEVRVCLAGDLIHSTSGFTDKGTKIEAHPLKEEQLEQAFSSLVMFLQEVLDIFPSVSVYSVPGNHDSMMDYTLAKMLSIYFKDEPRINFEITSKRFLTFKILDSFFLLDHGYAATTKSRLPRHGPSRNNYINTLLLSKADLLYGVKHKYYLSADQHHSESYESNGFEGFMFPTLAGGCRYADNSVLRSRQRQTGLVVTEKGVSEVIYFYFDQ